jgi:hypothetical protein
VWRPVARTREMRNICLFKILVGKPIVKRPVSRLSYRWEDNIKMDLKHRVWVCRLDLVAQNTILWRDVEITVMILRVP